MQIQQHAPTATASSGSGSTVRVELPSQLGADGVTRLYQMLAPLVDAAGPVILGAARIERVHAATLQVLVAFVRARAGARWSTVVQDASTALRDGAERAGLSAALGLTALAN